MKINNIKINSYGNINEKEIELSEKINIIQGKNESGKSTLLKFIINSFYGISKNKRGKEFSDYDRYKPWGKEEFSGKIVYTIDSGKKYEVFRDFNKKNPRIYNQDSEEISKQFSIDKTNGNQFFYEQTKIDETMFVSTLISEQGEVKLNSQTQNFLIQKVANLAGTGDEKISYKKAMDKLSKKQTDEIGTYRTQGKPINIVEERIRQIQDEINEIENYKNKQYEIESEKNYLEKQIKEDEEKIELITKITKIKEIEKMENEKIKLNERIKQENQEKIKQLQEQKMKVEQKEPEKTYIEENNKEINKIKNKQKKSNIIISTITLTMIIISILGIIIEKPIISYIAGAIGIIEIIELIIKNIIAKNKIEKQTKIQKEKNIEKIKQEEEHKKEIEKIEAQIEILEKSNENQKKQIQEMQGKINLKINLEKEKIKNDKIGKEQIEYYMKKENINYELEEMQNKINKDKLKIHALELDKNNLIPSLEKLSALEEEKEDLKAQKETLLDSNESIELAKEVLEIAYQKMKESVTPKFTQNLSKNIEIISNKKYKNVRINDEDGIIVEKENGEYISAEKLSMGTIDQLYIALRFAMVEEITNESMPIILDEAFAYYDSERLKNILKYINTEFKNNQIIIFTCTEREKEILNQENIEYKLITM